METENIETKKSVLWLYYSKYTKSVFKKIFTDYFFWITLKLKSAYVDSQRGE